MATNNAINLGTAGIAAYNGTGTFSGRTLTAGSGISIANGNGVSGDPTITAIGGGFTWTDVTGTTQTLAANNGYVADNAGLVTFTLPAGAAVIGDTFKILGKGAGGWLVAQNAAQAIHVGSSATTTGVTGSIASTNLWDTVELTCVTAGTSSIWQARVTGNITVA